MPALLHRLISLYATRSTLPRNIGANIVVLGPSCIINIQLIYGPCGTSTVEGVSFVSFAISWHCVTNLPKVTDYKN